MIIDKKGKLFGKINIIDLLIILVLVAAVAVAGVRFLTAGDAEKKKAEEPDLLRFTYYAEEVNDWVADSVKVGDELFDATYAQEVGEVTDIVLGVPETYGINAEGQYVPAPREGFHSIKIVSEVRGTKTDIGAEINEHLYGVGHSMVLYAGDAKIYLRLMDIELLEHDETKVTEKKSSAVPESALTEDANSSLPNVAE